MSNTYRVNKKGKKIQDREIKSMRFDRTCRNHGSCSWCTDNRQFSSKRRAQIQGEIDV